ncbi:hypothetical protein E1B28_012703 [Marasmius oreades]|uniref:Uncharacterized protein n=1 Tax=Marasmius oreades TaxID=181124 RepID=A0A9P7RST9_9AGAR|nr:uncharacterized protein E1B28_012703 [Marasmius oreades]KAG7088735.1 hypothetical protein E1B28_012703 [Marasmius oreades]
MNNDAKDAHKANKASIDLDNLTPDEMNTINPLDLSQRPRVKDTGQSRQVEDDAAQVLLFKHPISPTKKASTSLRTLANERKEAAKEVVSSSTHSSTPQCASPLLEQYGLLGSQHPAHPSPSTHLLTSQTVSPHLEQQAHLGSHPAHLASPFPEVPPNRALSVAHGVPVGPSYIYNYPHGSYFTSPGPSTVQMFAAPALTSGAPVQMQNTFNPLCTSTPVQSHEPRVMPSTFPAPSSVPALSPKATSVIAPPSTLRSGLTSPSPLSSTTSTSVPTSIPKPASASTPLSAVPDSKLDNDSDVINSTVPGGCFTQAQRSALEAAFSAMNNTMRDCAKETGFTEKSILNRFAATHGFTRKGNVWNIFGSSMRNVQVRALILGKLEGNLKWDGKSNPSKEQTSEAYSIFKKTCDQNGSNDDDSLFKEILVTAATFSAPVELQTQQARHHLFDKASKELGSFGDQMRDCYGITVVAGMTGQSVDDDRSLTYLYDRDKA